MLTNVFNTIWQKEDVPGDWRQGVILPLPKKDCLSDCNNWRGITLMSVPGKTFRTVLLNRLNTEVDRLLREEQARFRHGRSCSEQIFTLRNIVEQCSEFQTPLFVNYVDFKKAFDSIRRESLWKILKLYGIPDKFINIFKSMYHHSNCCVKTRNGLTSLFDVITGVRQSCVLSPLLFLICIDYVMRKALSHPEFRIPWGRGKLTDLDFADDVALLSHFTTTLQQMTDSLKTSADMVGLRISSDKTKVSTVSATDISISISQQTLE